MQDSIFSENILGIHWEREKRNYLIFVCLPASKKSRYNYEGLDFISSFSKDSKENVNFSDCKTTKMFLVRVK
jgi:hypothetical protein